MPLYRCAIQEGLSSEEQRAQIAREVVRVHCGVTGAPPSFVHAFFQERLPSELPDGHAAFVFGTIRWGRTVGQKAEIVSELRSSVATVLGCADSQVGVVTVDIPSKWNMEGGSLLPEPGEEAAWLEHHRS